MPSQAIDQQFIDRAFEIGGDGSGTITGQWEEIGGKTRATVTFTPAQGSSILHSEEIERLDNRDSPIAYLDWSNSPQTKTFVFDSSRGSASIYVAFDTDIWREIEPNIFVSKYHSTQVDSFVRDQVIPLIRKTDTKNRSVKHTPFHQYMIGSNETPTYITPPNIQVGDRELLVTHASSVITRSVHDNVILMNGHVLQAPANLLAGVFVHELGHIVDTWLEDPFYLGATYGREVISKNEANFTEYRENASEVELRQYLFTNRAEWFAETFSSYFGFQTGFLKNDEDLKTRYIEQYLLMDDISYRVNENNFINLRYTQVPTP